MTEKRYYEKNYDELYYIFDSKTLTEKEFEKKIEYDGYDVFADSLTSKEVVDLLNELHEENEKLKKRLKEKGDNLKEYYYDENGKKIESFNNEKLLTSLLQDIINELQDGWYVTEFESDFSNDVDINTLEVFEKNFCMKVSLRRTKRRELFF